MRSLWRILALQWLGGEASEALTRDSTVLESLSVGEDARRQDAFDVQRRPGVSHQAMMAPGPERRLDVEIAAGDVLPGMSPKGHERC